MLAYSLHCNLCKILLASITKVGGSAIRTSIVLSVTSQGFLLVPYSKLSFLYRGLIGIRNVICDEMFSSN